MKSEKNKPTPESESPARKKGETLAEKVHRHISDKNDIITEEDLRDVVIAGITPVEEEKSEELVNELEKQKKLTPWDVIDDKE